MKKSKKLSLILIITSLLGCNNIILESTKKIEEPKKNIVISKTQEPVIIASISPTPIKIESPKIIESIKPTEQPKNSITQDIKIKTDGKPENSSVISIPTPTSSNVGNGVNNISSFEPIPTSTPKTSSCIDEKPAQPPDFSNIKPKLLGCGASTGGGIPSCSYSTPNPNPYSTNFPIMEGLQTGVINLIFKDEYKIRYNFEKKEFYSLLCSINTSEVNKIINSFSSITQILGGLGSMSEEKAREEELSLEANYNYDVINKGSSYYIYIKELNAKELIESLRKLEYVRESNVLPERDSH
ncbi:MAG: hypothetical protein U0457_16605 [Candidatus Sericytochromatia bacterium]